MQFKAPVGCILHSRHLFTGEEGNCEWDVRAFFLQQRHHVMPSIRLMVFPLAPADGAGFAEGLLDTAAAGVRTDCTTRDGDIRTGADTRAASWTKLTLQIQSEYLHQSSTPKEAMGASDQPPRRRPR